MEEAPAGITGSFSMFLVMVFRRFSEKNQLRHILPPSLPNTVRLIRCSRYLSLILNNYIFNFIVERENIRSSIVKL